MCNDLDDYIKEQVKKNPNFKKMVDAALERRQQAHKFKRGKEKLEAAVKGADPKLA